MAVDKTGLNYYLVGGAVRDQLLGKEPKDYDYVVVGETPESMENRGFKQVGKGFPVFLDEEGNEFALARTEEKTGKGYDGFKCDWKGTSLKEDLKRRDLTINAMAMDNQGNIIDLFNGRVDLSRKRLRPVSEAFSEDPLRVLRACRYATRFDEQFKVTNRLKRMCRQIANELQYLPGERIGEEVIKAFEQANHIRYYMELLERTDAIKYIAPELKVLQNVPAGYNDYHQEGSTWEHTLLVMEQMEKLRPNDTKAYLGAMCHDLGKYISHYVNDKNNHAKHDQYGIPLAEKLSERWKLSNDYKQSTVNASRFHIRIMNIPEMKSGKTIKFVQKLNKYNIDRLLDLIECDKKGRKPQQAFDRGGIEEHIDKAQKAIDNYTGQDLVDEGYEGEGEAFGMTLLNRRANLYSKYVKGD